MSTPETTPSGTPSRTLSEADSKEFLAPFGLPIAPEQVVTTAAEAADAATAMGFPVVAKLCGDTIAHKTERGLVRLGLADDDAVAVAATDLLAAARPEDGDVRRPRRPDDPRCPRADRRSLARPPVRHDRDGRHRRHPRRGDRRRGDPSRPHHPRRRRARCSTISPRRRCSASSAASRRSIATPSSTC